MARGSLAAIPRGAPSATVDEAARARMVARLEEDGTIRDPRVGAVLRRVPRERFVPPERAADAFLDAVVPLGEGQTVSAPHMVAWMLEALDVEPHHLALDVGAGSGYAAACLAALARRVVAVERLPALARRARANLAAAGVGNVDVVLGDGSRPPLRTSFDRIQVAAAAPAVPRALVAALAPGGILVVPVGGRGLQRLVRVVMEPDGRVREEFLGDVAFVPLVGDEGWPP